MHVTGLMCCVMGGAKRNLVENSPIEKLRRGGNKPFLILENQCKKEQEVDSLLSTPTIPYGMLRACDTRYDKLAYELPRI